MKIGRKFNLLSVKEYRHYIENHKKYADFNTLGLYRSILENEKLTLADRIEVRDYANKFFEKTFEFLQIKDPWTYSDLLCLGEVLTAGDKEMLWRQISSNQQKILKSKSITHRNFGVYSKHSCGYETCSYNGLMIEEDSFWTEHEMRFDSDRNKSCAQFKSARFKKERKNKKKIIKTLLDSTNEY